MGLDDADLLEQGDRGGGRTSSVSCSICLEVVSYNGERSWAKLQCGHEFHLDCIGSAFNIKGAMQCPNCRKIEKGQWLYSSGCRPFPEFNMDEWAHDEDLYDLGYSEMSLGVQWCPFSGLARLSPSFNEGDFSSTAYHEFQHAIFAEQTTVASASHHCPYVTYFGPVHPSPPNSSGTVSDSSNVNSHWNGLSVPSEVHTSYAFPAMDVHYRSWEHHSSAFPTTSRMGASNQPSIPPVSQRATRANSDIPRAGSFLRPFFGGHSSASAARAVSSVAASIIPPYPGSVARSRDRVQALQAYFQQTSNSPAMRTPVISVTRRSSGHRGLAQVRPMPSSSDQTSSFFVFPSDSSGRNFQEAENPVPSRFHAWEREHSPSFPLSQVNRDQGWGSFHHGAGRPESSLRPLSRLRQRQQGSERTPSQNRS